MTRHDVVDGRLVAASMSFWASAPLCELAQAQCVQGCTDISEVELLWPPAADPDVFLAWVAQERRVRRAISLWEFTAAGGIGHAPAESVGAALDTQRNHAAPPSLLPSC